MAASVYYSFYYSQDIVDMKLRRDLLLLILNLAFAVLFISEIV